MNENIVSQSDLGGRNAIMTTLKLGNVSGWGNKVQCFPSNLLCAPYVHEHAPPARVYMHHSSFKWIKLPQNQIIQVCFWCLYLIYSFCYLSVEINIKKWNRSTVYVNECACKHSQCHPAGVTKVQRSVAKYALRDLEIFSIGVFVSAVDN